MTVKVIEIDDGNGLKKWFAYHAHIVYHDDPNSVDFDPNNNSTVEVMAELPHSSHLAAMRSAKQMGIAEEHDAPVPARQAMIDVVCPDPKCGSVTTYPAAGDPEARSVHGRYKADVTGDNHPMRLALDMSNQEHVAPLHAEIKPFIANAWARADLGLHPTVGHDHLHVQHTNDRFKIVPPGHAEHKALIKRFSLVKV